MSLMNTEYDDDEDHITYTIQLTCQANETAWNISKRYNDFHRLNTELQKDRNFRGIKLPHFPGKAISFTDASKKELAEERMEHLQNYLNGLLSRTIFASALSVRAFLQMPETVKNLAVILSNRQNAALKQGYMEKKGELNKKWRKRWFVLQPNYLLKYYKEEKSTIPQGSIDIQQIVQVKMKNTTSDKKYSFTLVANNRRWFLACENETEKREWTRMFMRLRDTKAPSKDNHQKSLNNNHHSHLTDAVDPKALNLGPHFKTVTQIKWCPTIPGILATGSEDESVKIWQTHLLDPKLVPAEYDNAEIDKILKKDETENDVDVKEDENENENVQKSVYPLHAIEFQPIAEYRTSGHVRQLEWSPDGSMLVASLIKSMSDSKKNGYFIQCFDLQPILGAYASDLDDFGGDGNLYDFDKNGANEDDMEDDADDSRTKIFTLQDHPSRLVFSSDGSLIYMAMDIDPISEENEKRRPAFLVYLDLTQNQLHRCKTVDRIIDHQTEFIVDMTMTNARTTLIVATSTHQNNGRIIVWNIEENTTTVIERKGVRISSLLFTDDDSWLIIGRINGKLEFWNVKNQNDEKMQNYYKQQIKAKDKSQSQQQKEEEEEEAATNITKDEGVLFEKKYEDTTCHSGPLFHLTTSNGILISSAKPSNLELNQSFFIDNVLWDIRLLMYNGKKPKLVSRMHNVNESEKDITRLLCLSPVTNRQVREGGGPGSLLAASGDHAVYCHNMMDILLDALSMGSVQ